MPQLHAADPEDKVSAATRAVLLISGMGRAYSTERRTASRERPIGRQMSAALETAHEVSSMDAPLIR
jgi:hypothetical protein